MKSSITLRQAVAIVCIANLFYFFFEFSVALHIKSVSLFADSVDFLEDSSVNFLILIALTWSLKARARLGMLLAGLLLCPTLATLWVVFHKLVEFAPPAPTALSVTGLGALIINSACAFLLASFRNHAGSITKAAFLSARNDAFANIAIIAAGYLTWLTHTAWPDLIVGLGIVTLNADAVREVWKTSRDEHLEAKKAAS